MHNDIAIQDMYRRYHVLLSKYRIKNNSYGPWTQALPAQRLLMMGKPLMPGWTSDVKVTRGMQTRTTQHCFFWTDWFIRMFFTPAIVTHTRSSVLLINFSKQTSVSPIQRQSQVSHPSKTRPCTTDAQHLRSQLPLLLRPVPFLFSPCYLYHALSYPRDLVLPHHIMRFGLLLVCLVSGLGFSRWRLYVGDLMDMDGVELPKMENWGIFLREDVVAFGFGISGIDWELELRCRWCLCCAITRVRACQQFSNVLCIPGSRRWQDMEQREKHGRWKLRISVYSIEEELV